MSQDTVADALNMIMNAKKADKGKVDVKISSKVLVSVLAIAKLKGYVKSYKTKERGIEIELGKIHGCKAIKPRYIISSKNMEKYISRYLPAKNIGILIISTSQGLMTHQTAIEKNIGGSLIAYMF